MIPFTPYQTALLAWGVAAHCLADWLLQNHWMNAEKTDLRKLGGWVHAGIHGAVSALVFPWPAALALAAAHLIIDTRTPLVWWGRIVQQSDPEQAGAAYIPFTMGRDQAAHIVCIAVAAWACGVIR
jgi:hypothetical protein